MKNIRRLLAGIVSIVLVFAFVGCAGEQVKRDDVEGKKKIFISVYNGGLGTEWINPVIAEFEKDYPDYYIEMEEKKRTVSEITSFIALESQADVYFSCVADFQELIYSNKVADLSSILDMKVDGDNRTIGDKLENKANWMKISSKNGSGMYMLPYEDCVLGFTYDHDKFLEYGLLYEAENSNEVKKELATEGISFTEQDNKLIFESSTNKVNYVQGDVILRAGKDGKYGTYDDGQPITMLEWDNMLNTLKGYGKAIIYSGKILDYTTDIFNGVFAQYDGIDGWNTRFSYDGEYTFEGNNTPTAITLQNGYETFKMTGIKKAVEFMNDYLNNREYTHDGCFMSEESHTDAQGHYVIGGAKDSNDAPFTGFLVDGVWWENEARTVFNNLAKDSRYADYAYGKRDYRIMLLPDMEGQKGALGNGKGSAISARSTGSCIITATDPDIIEKAKIFLAYTCKDKYLQHFTELTGAPRPFDYTLTDENWNSMTKYAKNCWELYHDKDNIGIIRPQLDKYLSPITYKSSLGYDVNWFTNINTIPYNIPMNALRIAQSSIIPSIKDNPTKAVFDGFYDFFSKKWNQFLSEMN